uniref:Uncharacterized protein n=1 Tax=Romanomermis culicivorax TaxID=13658 RepID=A0A915IKZ5_ROMCU
MNHDFRQAVCGFLMDTELDYPPALLEQQKSAINFIIVVKLVLKEKQNQHFSSKTKFLTPNSEFFCEKCNHFHFHRLQHTADDNESICGNLFTSI